MRVSTIQIKTVNNKSLFMRLQLREDAASEILTQKSFNDRKLLVFFTRDTEPK